MPEIIVPQPKKFIRSIKDFGVNISWNPALHVFHFWGERKKIDYVKDFFAEQPELERDMLAEKNIPWHGLTRKDINIRRHMYCHLLRLWEPPYIEFPERLDKLDRLCKKYWYSVIAWLKKYGGEFPDLPGAVRYVFNEEEKRIDGLPKYPASFPSTW